MVYGNYHWAPTSDCLAGWMAGWPVSGPEPKSVISSKGLPSKKWDCSPLVLFFAKNLGIERVVESRESIERVERVENKG